MTWGLFAIEQSLLFQRKLMGDFRTDNPCQSSHGTDDKKRIIVIGVTQDFKEEPVSCLSLWTGRKTTAVPAAGLLAVRHVVPAGERVLLQRSFRTAQRVR